MIKTDKVAKRFFSRFLPASFSLGVEVSEHAIKLVLVKQESPDSVSLLDYLISPFTKDASYRLDPATIIENVLREKKLFTATEARLAISGTELDCKRITLPFMPKKEIAQALRLQTKDHFLFDIEGAVLDFEVLDETTTKDGTRNIEVIASLAKKEFIDKKISFFEATRVPPAVVIPVAYGVYNVYRLHREKESAQPLALIDIGASTTTVVIIKDDKIRFIRQLGCAGKDFTNAMTGTLVSDKGRIELSLEEAEKLKIQMGIPDESTPPTKEGISPQQISSMVRPVIERLGNEIKRSFDYYISEFNEGRIKKAFITGGSSKLKNIHSQLSHRLKDKYSQAFPALSIPVESLEIPPELKIDLIPERAEDFKKDFPLLVPAIGAAINSPRGINLIPLSYKMQRIRKIERISLRIIFILISLVLLTFYLFDSMQERLLRNLLIAKQPQWQNLREIQEFHSKIVQKNAIIDYTLKNQVPLYYIFKTLSNLTPKPVYLESLVIEDKVSNLKMEGVILETVETAEATLTKFIKTLEDSPFFNNVYLISSQDTSISGRQALKFEISCKLGKR